MKIINLNKKKNFFKVKLENLEDLWYLSTIIEPKDILNGYTQRKIKLDASTERKTIVTKKTIPITLEVEKAEFHKFSNALRVSGKIIEAPEDIKKGSYHTFNLEENSIVTVEKQNLYDFQIKKIEEASKDISSNILIVALDREEACFALLKKYGYDYLSEIQGEVPKKQDKKQIESTFYNEILSQIKEYDKKFKLSKIVIGSPAFWKEDLFKIIEKKDSELAEKITLSTCNTLGKNAIEEILKREEVKKILKEDRITKEIEQVELLLEKIAKNEPATYGLNDVKTASDLGAITTLLVTDTFLHKMRDNNQYSLLDEIMKNVEKKKGSIFIISTEHESGKKLDGLTGIAAILRYKVN